MVSNEEIMDMLKLILEKVERLENINTDNVTITSGSITIQGMNNPIEIEEANDVLIQTTQNSPIGFEQAENVTVNASEAGTVSIECDGSIEGDLTVSANSAAKAVLTVECNGDINGDVHGDIINRDE